jgi:hypothetical protein
MGDCWSGGWDEGLAQLASHLRFPSQTPSKHTLLAPIPIVIYVGYTLESESDLCQLRLTENSKKGSVASSRWKKRPTYSIGIR